MEAALNAQLNAEVYSGYLYLSMAAYFEDIDLAGFANWMRVQAAEELEHGMKFYDYIIRRGASVTLTAIEAPQTIEEKDHATNNFLQWFVEEQVEEEENAMENLAKLKLAGDDNSLLYKLNEEFAGRGTAE